MNQSVSEMVWNESLQKKDIDVFVNNENSEPTILKSVLVSLVLGCIVVLTVGGNITVLLAVYLELHLRNTTNYFIVNLAIADLFLGVIVLPLSATLEVLNYWPFGEILCDVWAAVDVLLCTASILTLCVISIDRYIGVTRPLQHSSIITKRRAVLIIAFVWVLSSIISVAPLIGWRDRGVNKGYECTVTKQIGYVMFSVAGSFYIPMFIIILVYVKIYREVSRYNQFLNSGSKTVKTGENNDVILRIHTARRGNAIKPGYQNICDSSGDSLKKRCARMTPTSIIAKFKREKKAAKTLGIVVGVFLICWFPFFVCLPLDVLCTSCHLPAQFFTVIFWLGYCNSLMNPFIYASSSREFKQAFINVLQCHWARKHIHHVRERSIFFKLTSRSKSKETNSCSPLLVSNNNICVSRKNTESPVKSLITYQEKRKISSPSKNTEMSTLLSCNDMTSDIHLEVFATSLCNVDGQETESL